LNSPLGRSEEMGDCNSMYHTSFWSNDVNLLGENVSTIKAQFY